MNPRLIVFHVNTYDHRTLNFSKVDFIVIFQGPRITCVPSCFLFWIKDIFGYDTEEYYIRNSLLSLTLHKTKLHNILSSDYKYR